ncbi:MAG TPA: response regulator transcription factor, partial [Candidatus Krumholzibacteria bacterium]
HGRFTFTHFWRGRIASWLGDESTLETELAWCDSIGSYYAPAFKAALLAHAGRFEEAREVARGALSRFAEKSSAETMAFSFSTLLFEAAVLSGDETATAELLTLLRGDPRRLAKPNLILLPRLEAKAAALLGKRQEARACFREAIEFCEGILYRPERALIRVDLAQLLLDHFPGERTEAMKHLDLAIAELEDMQMAPALAQARALQERLATGPTPRPSYPDGLSAREVEVLRLIATGKTNQQIADELVISLNTVLHHVSNILAKTSTANRGEAAAYAHRHGIAD